MSRKTWPANKPLPRFASEAEELAFWETHDVPWDDDAEAEEVPGPAVAMAAKKTVKVTLPAAQAATLNRIAKRQRVSNEQALEAIIGEALRSESPRRKRVAG